MPFAGGTGGFNNPSTPTTPGTGGGSTTFVGLTDTPAAYTNAAGRTLIVNQAEDGVDFIATLAPYDSASNTGGYLQATDFTVSADGNTLTLPDGTTFTRDTTTPLTTFLQLTDTPSAYGTSGNVVVVNNAGDGLITTSPVAGLYIFEEEDGLAVSGQDNVENIRVSSDFIWTVGTGNADDTITLSLAPGAGSAAAPTASTNRARWIFAGTAQTDATPLPVGFASGRTRMVDGVTWYRLFTTSGVELITLSLTDPNSDENRLFPTNAITI